MKSEIEAREHQVERLLTEAAAVASGYGQSRVGPDHLLFVIAGTEEGRRTIEDMGGRPRCIRDFLLEAFGADTAEFRGGRAAGMSRFEPALRKVIEVPVAESRTNIEPVSFRRIVIEMIRLGEECRITREALCAGRLLERNDPERDEDYRLDEERDEEHDEERPKQDSGKAGSVENASVRPGTSADETGMRDRGAFADNDDADPASALDRVRQARARPPEDASRAPGRAAAGQEVAADGDEHRKAVLAAMRNLTAEAERGRVDPVIGRDELVGDVVDIVCRRRKQNVLLYGEPGVGKSAIGEGLALAMRTDAVPQALRDRPLIEVSMSDLVAGARYRGDFEMRMRKLLEITRSERAILFVDEMHLMVGAGTTSGRAGMDASNILKPALARGDISIIGATTPGEMREIRKDGALMRRFQPVAVHEPDANQTRAIIDEAVGGYVLHHEVVMDDDVLDAVVALADRHLPHRRFPDKAFDLIDMSSVVARRRGATRAELCDLRTALHRVGGPRLGPPSPEMAARARGLGRALKARVFGQEDAADALARAVRLNLLGLHLGGTAGSYLFNGPSGVGKSALAEALADEMSLPLVRVSLSEFTEAHSVARLIGAPPGYVGYEEEGLLTAAGDVHTEMVLLLDEIDKAHSDVYDILLQVLDNGTLRAGDGRTVSLRGAHVVMTANLGASGDSEPVGFTRAGDAETRAETRAEEAVAERFRSEFIARIECSIQFRSLGDGVLGDIAEGELRKLAERLGEAGYRIEIADGVASFLVGIAKEDRFAVRSLQSRVRSCVADPLADAVLDDPEAPAFEVGMESGRVSVEPA